jgi:hypothetical protein
VNGVFHFSLNDPNDRVRSVLRCPGGEVAELIRVVKTPEYKRHDGRRDVLWLVAADAPDMP